MSRRTPRTIAGQADATAPSNLGRRTFLSIAAAAGAVGAGASRAAVAARAPFTIALLGDCLFTQGLDRGDPELAGILKLTRRADVTVANFEGTLADATGWAAALGTGVNPSCGGMNIRGDAAVPRDLAWMGVDMVGTANNHAADWGPQGIAATLRKLTRAGIAHSGTGRDLAEARRPAYREVGGRRVALVACASTFAPGALASHGNATVPGRPGVSPARLVATRRGAGEKATLLPADLADILDSVRTARETSDIVLLSCHTHEDDGDRQAPPGFLQDLARSAIDAGADAVFSHGPHVLRGIEVYRGKPIFYSLGAFIFRARETRQQPEELYESCGLSQHDPLVYFERLEAQWRGDPLFWESAVPTLTFRNSRLAGISLTPTVIQHDAAPTWGMPALAGAERGEAILRRLQALSAPFKTAIAVDGGVGHVQI